jgi:hypothetical protein
VFFFKGSKLVMSTLLKTSTWPAAKNKTSRAVNPAAAKDEEFRKWCLHIFASAMELWWRDWHS